MRPLTNRIRRLGRARRLLLGGVVVAVLAAIAGTLLAVGPPSSGGAERGTTVSRAVTSPDGSAITVSTPDGEVVLPELSDRLDPAALRYLGRAGLSAFFEGPSRDGAEQCFLLAGGTDATQLGCNPVSRFRDRPMVFWADPPRGPALGAMRLPAGYDSATVAGRPAQVVGGVVVLRGVDLTGTRVVMSGEGVPDSDYVIS